MIDIIENNVYINHLYFFLTQYKILPLGYFQKYSYFMSFLTDSIFFSKIHNGISYFACWQ